MVFTIKGYTGAMGVDGWDRTAWRKEFTDADVLVMTCKFNGILSSLSPNLELQHKSS
jgi:hypothetical protein